ncbi:MAG: hypothetical protein KatS3mg072_0128 [Meiothermus sp.]|nr:MAG: hypothetical protein KatS3mg072_0128 [Meiothermus sp.]
MHAQVDDRGYLRRVLLRPAQEHDVTVAVRLLRGLKYVVVTGDRGYLSRGLKAEVARQGVDLIARHKRNMRPHSQRERCLLRGHRIIESVFSSLDRLGLSERPYRKTRGLIFHIYAVLLGYGLRMRMEHDPAWKLLISYGRRLEIGWGCFSELGLTLSSSLKSILFAKGQMSLSLLTGLSF